MNTIIIKQGANTCSLVFEFYEDSKEMYAISHAKAFFNNEKVFDVAGVYNRISANTYVPKHKVRWSGNRIYVDLFLPINLAILHNVMTSMKGSIYNKYQVLVHSDLFLEQSGSLLNQIWDDWEVKGEPNIYENILSAIEDNISSRFDAKTLKKAQYLLNSPEFIKILPKLLDCVKKETETIFYSFIELISAGIDSYNNTLLSKDEIIPMINIDTQTNKNYMRISFHYESSGEIVPIGNENDNFMLFFGLRMLEIVDDFIIDCIITPRERQSLKRNGCLFGNAKKAKIEDNKIIIPLQMELPSITILASTVNILYGELSLFFGVKHSTDYYYNGEKQ